MIKAWFKKYTLRFKFPAGTSRGIMHARDSWFLFIQDTENLTTGIGECAPLKDLSPDKIAEIEPLLKKICRNISYYLDGAELSNDYPSVKFGIETATLDFKHGGKREIIRNDFTDDRSFTIPINGLVWMGSPDMMKKQVKTKIEEGFTCIKMKIGVLDPETELEMIKDIRKQYGSSIEIRVDANGAYTPAQARRMLGKLAGLQVHSVEQPIPPGLHDEMRLLCLNSPIPVALDEELIRTSWDPATMLNFVRPQYVVLKPGLLGGFKHCEHWIGAAEKLGVGWWITSALESNIGLNAIAQWTAGRLNGMAQGLGTGMLYTNNFPSPLEVANGTLRYNKEREWDLGRLFDETVSA